MWTESILKTALFVNDKIMIIMRFLFESFQLPQIQNHLINGECCVYKFLRRSVDSALSRNNKNARNCCNKKLTFCCRLISKLADLVCSFLRAAFITAISDSLDFRTRVISIFALKKKNMNKQTKKLVCRAATTTSPNKSKIALRALCFWAARPCIT